MQNDLGETMLIVRQKQAIDLSSVEFFSMADFTNPGILGTIDHFRKHFQSPILNGREPDAPESVRAKGQLAQVNGLSIS
jgi:hypothetical protein